MPLPEHDDAAVADRVARPVRRQVDADERAVGDDDVLVQDRVAHHRAAADPHARHDHRVHDLGAVVDPHVRATAPSCARSPPEMIVPAPTTDSCATPPLTNLAGGSGADRGADRPALVVEVEDRVHRHQVHVRVVVRVQRPDVAPVAAVAVGGAGHLVVGEVVDVRPSPCADQPRDDVAAHVVIGVVVVGVGRSASISTSVVKM